MEMILPGISFSPGGKWAAPPVNADAPQQFIRVLDETMGLCSAESRKEVQSDSQEAIPLQERAAHMEKDMHIGYSEGFAGNDPDLSISLGDATVGEVSKEETDASETVPEPEGGQHKKAEAEASLQETMENAGSCGLLLVREHAMEKAESYTGRNDYPTVALPQEPESAPVCERSAFAAGHYHGLQPDRYPEIKQAKAKHGHEAWKIGETGLENLKPPSGKEQGAVRDELEGENPSMQGGLKVADAFTGKPSSRGDHRAVPDKLEGQNPSFQEGRRTGFFTGTQPLLEPEGISLPAGLASRVIDPIVKGIQVQRTLKDEVSEIRVRLKPESLGEVLIKISREDGQVNGRIFVENLMVKEVLENRLPLFRERLAEMDIELKEMHVSLGNNSDQESGAGLPAWKGWPPWSMRGKVLEPADSDRPVRVMRGILDILA
ncbi:MAG: flagellar hook-length control protein FliK [Dethiobacter sp.]|jgi:hypothetical protein|nr:MAG: flagellar hook-length control protein FliK [Dethiobacter sp.]